MLNKAERPIEGKHKDRQQHDTMFPNVPYAFEKRYLLLRSLRSMQIGIILLAFGCFLQVPRRQLSSDISP